MLFLIGYLFFSGNSLDADTSFYISENSDFYIYIVDSRYRAGYFDSISTVNAVGYITSKRKKHSFVDGMNKGYYDFIITKTARGDDQSLVINNKPYSADFAYKNKAGKAFKRVGASEITQDSLYLDEGVIRSQYFALDPDSTIQLDGFFWKNIADLNTLKAMDINLLHSKQKGRKIAIRYTLDGKSEELKLKVASKKRRAELNKDYSLY